MKKAENPQDPGGSFSYIVPMRHIASASVLVFLILLSGCINTLQPLYTEEDVIFDSALVGQWIEEKDTWNVTRRGEKSYSVLHSDANKKKGEFVGHLVKVGDALFVDLFPVKPDCHDSGFFQDRLLRAHTFFLVVRTEPTPQFAFLDEDWLLGYLKKNPNSLRHERIDNPLTGELNQILITASSKQLQRFLLSHVKTAGAFKENKPWQAQDTLTPWSSRG